MNKRGTTKKKIILLYPYFNGISGAYNRYILFKKLIEKINIPVKLINLYEKKNSYGLQKIFNKIIKFIKVELLIFYYCLVKKNYLITDFNPSIIALFSKKVFIQIHDVSWENKNFRRHNFFLYKVLKFFIKNYSNIITVSNSSMNSIKNLSARKKNISYIYNSVSVDYIRSSNYLANKNNLENNKFITNSIDFDLPNIIYIATLSPRKCHSDLLNALSKTNNLLNINLVGYPSDKKIMELININSNSDGKKLKSNINFFPELSQKHLCSLLLFSSAYVSTSLCEGFGIPVLEAYLYNLPLILRDIDINRELFPDAKFFNSGKKLVKILDKLKPLSKVEIKNRRKILDDINEENLKGLFNYSTLSNQLSNLI